MEHSARETYEMHVIVKGKVQGVGFRAMTRNHAKLLGLMGSVRNLPNGSVEIYAQGPKEHLEDFMGKLKEETTPGQIEEATIEYFPVNIPHEDFRILH